MLLRTMEGAADLQSYRFNRHGENMADSDGASKPPAVVMLGESPAYKAALAQADRFARLDHNILLTGETGTGKGLMARYIHAQSRRADQPFLEVSCPNLPESLAESELFGHLKGAFTGATTDHKGLLREAQGGTVFLDEIGELSAGLQSRLLSAVEHRQVRPVGGTEVHGIRARLTFATLRALDAMTADGRFRMDLYHRIHVLHVHLPPLRERGRDVLILARHFLTWAPELDGLARPAISRTGEDFLLAWTFPGNMRELRYGLLRAAALADGRELNDRRLEAAFCGVRAQVGESRVIAERGQPAQTSTRRTSGARQREEPQPPSEAELMKLAEQVHVLGPKILCLALDHGRIQRADVTSAFDASDRTVDRVLAGLVAAGVLVKDGRKGNAGGYVVVGLRLR